MEGNYLDKGTVGVGKLKQWKKIREHYEKNNKS